MIPYQDSLEFKPAHAYPLGYNFFIKSYALEDEWEILKRRSEY